MARNDPTDTGGLFIGRRPGTAPLKYRDTPQRGQARRQRIDGAFANVVWALLALVVLSCWGAQPVAWLWIGSRIAYLSDSIMLGITGAFFGLLVSLMATLWVSVRLDGLWRILRRAAGHDQKDGILGRMFMWTAIVVGGGFFFWFVVIQGPGSGLVPNQ